MSDDVNIENQPTTTTEADRARSLLARSRGGTSDRPVGPPRTDTPSFRDVVQQEVVPPRPGIPTMKPGELRQRLQTGDAVPGIGSAYPENQPGPSRAPGLRPETAEMLQAVAEATEAAQNAPAEPPAPPAAPKAEVKDPDDDVLSAAEVAATLRGLQGQSTYSPVRAIFTNARREALEKELKPLSISDILMNQDARQRVPLAEGIHVTYRSLNGHETDFIEKFIWDRFNGDLTQQMYAMTSSLVALTLSMIQVGKTNLPECRGEYGDVNEKLFTQKWKACLKWPAFILEAADINRVWFEERCSKLLNVAAVGNG